MIYVLSVDGIGCTSFEAVLPAVGHDHATSQTLQICLWF
jgi:hypothetical protein